MHIAGCGNLCSRMGAVDERGKMEDSQTNDPKTLTHRPIRRYRVAFAFSLLRGNSHPKYLERVEVFAASARSCRRTFRQEAPSRCAHVESRVAAKRPLGF